MPDTPSPRQGQPVARDLLAACKKILGHIDEVGDDDDRAVLQEAIAKAEGR